MPPGTIFFIGQTKTDGLCQSVQNQEFGRTIQDIIKQVISHTVIFKTAGNNLFRLFSISYKFYN